MFNLKNVSIPLSVISTLMLPACSTSEATFGDKIQSESAAMQAIGEDWNKGAAMVLKGQDMIAEGNELVEDGEELIEDGEDLIDDGKSMKEKGNRKKSDGQSLIEDGEAKKRVAENRYKAKSGQP